MKIGITFGVFDLLHVGHLAMLEEAKKQCDYLIVGLKTEMDDVLSEHSEAAQTVVERFIKLEGCQYVDEIIPFASDEDLLDILQTVPIDVRFIGEEYRETDFAGKELCLQEGIAIQYMRRRHRFSSQALRAGVSQKERTKQFKGEKPRDSQAINLLGEIRNAMYPLDNGR
ncbi:adenylyltransferase/cytidyltransferase family protein [Sphingobacterium suaedae]|uniref:Adenylyltransferase/cytidyltransferase family protein n=1 Tax=Sphingobacterium suaedae TaxID=1686402 RepID=A0ABW5KCR2_9SPHI